MTTINTAERIASQAIQDALNIRKLGILSTAEEINEYASKLASVYQGNVYQQAYVAVFSSAYEKGNPDITAYL